MQYVRQAGSDPSFLLKALGEASGELRHLLEGLRRGVLLIQGQDPDHGWTLLGIACHMRDVELGVYEQIATIAGHRGEPRIEHVDIDDIPLREDYEDEEEDEVLSEFHYYRRQTAYALWDLGERDWERSGVSPYRGRMSVMEIVRELYRHDLEHLWQARRMVDNVVAKQR